MPPPRGCQGGAEMPEIKLGQYPAARLLAGIAGLGYAQVNFMELTRRIRH